MSRSRTRRVARVVAAVVAAATTGPMLGGCSQLYWDRRDAIGLSAGDAIAANEAMQTIDPWPPASGNTNLAFNGQRMQTAAERYRTNKVIPPGDPMALTVATPSAADSSSSSGGTSGSSTSNTTVVVGAPASTTTSTSSQ
jgi:hypothetical protein